MNFFNSQVPNPTMVNVTDYLDEHLVCFLDVETRDEALTALIELCDAAGKLKDKGVFHKAILDREKIVSTGIGMGIAIPHAKLPAYDDFFIAIGIPRKSIDWNALDRMPVRFIFMIGGPDDKQTEYLQILSSLTMAVKGPAMREKLMTISSPEEIVNLFRSGGDHDDGSRS